MCESECCGVRFLLCKVAGDGLPIQQAESAGEITMTNTLLLLVFFAVEKYQPQMYLILFVFKTVWLHIDNIESSHFVFLSAQCAQHVDCSFFLHGISKSSFNDHSVFLHLSEGAFQLSPTSVKLKPLLESALGGS